MKWAAMELSLMEDNKPELLKERLEAGTLEEWLDQTQDRMEEKHSNLLQQGLNSLEANEVVRQELLEEYLPEM